METQLVLIERDGPTAVITMNRPAKRNALSPELVAALTKTFKQVGDDESVRSVILTGADPVFCAGLDLSRLNTKPVEGQPDVMTEKSAESLMELFETIEHLPKPTIAAVNGHAVAGGAGLMTTCDMVVASREAGIGYTEVKRGLTAVIVMTYLHRQISDRHVRELLLTGDLIPAEVAARMGLINWVVDPKDVLPKAREVAAGLIECGPMSLALTKRLLSELHALPPEKRHSWAVKWNAQMRRQAEALEGVAAYREKRKPDWAT